MIKDILNEGEDLFKLLFISALFGWALAAGYEFQTFAWPWQTSLFFPAVLCFFVSGVALLINYPHIVYGFDNDGEYMWSRLVVMLFLFLAFAFGMAVTTLKFGITVYGVFIPLLLFTGWFFLIDKMQNGCVSNERDKKQLLYVIIAAISGSYSAHVIGWGSGAQVMFAMVLSYITAYFVCNASLEVCSKP